MLRMPCCLQVNPDTPQRAVRFAALSAGKTLLTPQPRLRTGFFNTLSVRDLPSDDVAFLREASTSAGTRLAVALLLRPLTRRHARRSCQVRQAARHGRARPGR